MHDPVLEVLQKQGLGFQVSGRDYVTKCLNPEHPDTNPSLRISRETGAFHCFACHFKGNIFKYFGILTNPTPLKITKLKQKLQALQLQHSLELPAGAVPFTRVFRGISTQTLKEFGAFYTQKEPKLEDRICFPITDVLGKTLVFVCRHTLSNGNPRYVNYPSGVSMPVFPASAPQNTKSIVLVEGLFDFLNLYDKGLKTAVCCFGTNTLQNNIDQKLFTFKAQGITHIFIMFDGDDAGAKAAQELKPKIEELGFVVEIIKLPDGLDPGDMDQETVDSIQEYTKR